MYTVAIKREFIARHFLIGGDWGAENDLHAHHYQIELQLHGLRLDDHGFLVDIVDIEKALETLVERYRDSVLNELTEFKGLNPSIEHFSRILCEALSTRIQAENIRQLTVKLWENEIAWASFQVQRD